MVNPIPQMTVTIEVEDEESFSRDVSADLSVNEATIDESLMNQASLYAYYSSLYWKAQRLYSRKNLEMENLKSDLWEKAREELQEGQSSRWTISKDRVEQAINRMPQVRVLKALVIEAETNARRLYGLMKALEHKKDMIQNICYNRRREMDFIGSNRVVKKQEIPKSGNEV